MELMMRLKPHQFFITPKKQLRLFFLYFSTNRPVLPLPIYSTNTLAVCNKSGAHMSGL